MKIKYNAVGYVPNETDFIMYAGNMLHTVIGDSNVAFTVICTYVPYSVVLTTTGNWYIKIDNHDNGDNRRIEYGTNGHKAVQKFFDMCQRARR